MGGVPHTPKKKNLDDFFCPNTSISGILVRLVSLQRTIEKWGMRVTGKVAAVEDGCGMADAEAWPTFC